MSEDVLKAFYEKDSERFWDPRNGLVGRDIHIAALAESSSGTILEYGCGSGSLLLSLAKMSKFEKAFGVDIAENALKKVNEAWEDISEENGLKKSKVECFAPKNDLMPNIKSNSCDLVITCDTLEHVLDPFVVVSELGRITKPGGSMIISVPNYGYLKYILFLFLGRQPVTGGAGDLKSWRQGGWDGWHLHTFTLQSARHLAEDSGWTVQKITGYGEKLDIFPINVLRRKIPHLFSGALTLMCRKS